MTRPASGGAHADRLPARRRLRQIACGGRSSSISAATRRAVAFDYPGYGDSDPAPEGTTRDDYAAAILAAMDALGIERRARLRPVARRRGRDRDARRRRRRMRVADPRRHLRRPSRRPGDLRARRSPPAATCAAWPKRASTSCSRSPPIRQFAAKWSRRWPRSIPPPTASAPGGLARRPARAARRPSACRRSSCAATEDRITPPALSRRAGEPDSRRAVCGTSRAPGTLPISTARRLQPVHRRLLSRRRSCEAY